MSAQRSGSASRVELIRLTPRESEVLALLLRGFENKRIAFELGIVEQSVKQHVSALLARFAVTNRAALAIEVGSVLELTGTLGIDRNWIQQLFRKAELQICIMRGPDLRYEAANEAFRKAVGDRPLLGRTMREVFPELEGQGIFERVERVYMTGEPDIQHERTSSWDRGQGVERRSIDLVLQPLWAEDSTVNGVLSFAVDVTELVSERERGELVCEELATILDLVPSGVIVTDEKGRIVKVNRAAQRIARTPFNPERPSDAQGVATFHVRDAAGRALARDELPVARALRGETVPTAVFRLAGGHPPQDIRIRASVRPLRDVGGRVRGAMLIFDELSV
ncbi:MAG TPA: PAS domain-containing protein [Candidatus Limnocylindria bacterium]|nr:PAS domain-containing protein [Candidatus Limnocylindria bacterium]